MHCAHPIANFAIEDGDMGTSASKVLPYSLSYKNLSKNASKYFWKLNGEIISENENLDHTLLESGRYVIELTAVEGGKSASKSTTIRIEPTTTCRVLMQTTAGDMVFELSENTLGHLNNFEELIESNYYKGLLFHRVIDGFMIQGGDNKTRTGGRRYDEPAEIPHEIEKSTPHYRGALAAARMPDDINPEKKSSGSQFYIVDGKPYTNEQILKVQESKLKDYTPEELNQYVNKGGAAQLDGEYTVFGHMVSGFDVLDAIAASSTDKYDRPTDDIKIIDVRFLN